MEYYDLAVIGAGVAGAAAASKAASLGARVAIVEKDKSGAPGSTRGVFPTKTLVASSEAIHTARRGESLVSG